jgi:hypothetical protein
MAKLVKPILVGCILALFPVALFGQTSDAGGIGAISVSKDFGRFVTASASQELRFNQNYTNFDRSLTSVGLDYTILSKLLKAEAEYDFICQNQIGYFEIRHRVALGLSATAKSYSFYFKLRTKLQSTFRDETRGDYKFNPKYVWRNKFECSYTIFGSPVKPFASAEVFCPLNSVHGFFMDGYRATAGVKYRTSAHVTWEFLLRCDQEIQQANPKRIFYTGVGWNYDL